VEWSRRRARVEARRREKLGALTLRDEIWRDAPDTLIAAAMTQGLRQRGIAALGFGQKTEAFRARAALMRGDFPDLSDDGLLEKTALWFEPHVGQAKRLEDLAGTNWLAALQALFTWDEMQELDRMAPPSFVTPLGRSVLIDYSGDAPAIALRLQEMLGQATHPVVGPDRTPIKITLLSPAGRPIQVTADLPGFWSSSYGDVRRDMRGRYPKHPWPEDPLSADPTVRAKPRR
jgi:ATP-dependent helicase HrpB